MTKNVVVGSIVSDLDYTLIKYNLFGHPSVTNDTVYSIKYLRSNGYKFMIVTSRSYDSAIKLIRKYNISFDYISTLSGCIIHDNKGNLVYSKDLSYLDLDELRKLYSCIDRVELIKQKDKALYYTYTTKLLKGSKKLIEFLEKSGLDVHSSFHKYNIAYPISNKIDSVRYIQDLYDLNDDKIITIGDGSDDVKILEGYPISYGVEKLISNPDALGNCKKIVRSIDEAFTDIKKNI